MKVTQEYIDAIVEDGMKYRIKKLRLIGKRDKK